MMHAGDTSAIISATGWARLQVRWGAGARWRAPGARWLDAPEAADAHQHGHHDAAAADAAGSAERRGEEGERTDDIVVRVQRQQALIHHCPRADARPALALRLRSRDAPAATAWTHTHRTPQPHMSRQASRQQIRARSRVPGPRGRPPGLALPFLTRKGLKNEPRTRLQPLSSFPTRAFTEGSRTWRDSQLAGCRTREGASMPIDYSKWNNLDDSDDEEEAVKPKPAAAKKVRVGRRSRSLSAGARGVQASLTADGGARGGRRWRRASRR